jgi:mono/diheme cytochrome c family protein
MLHCQISHQAGLVYYLAHRSCPDHCPGSMEFSRMSKRLRTAVLATLWCTVSQAADPEAGRVVAQLKCSQCHAATDWEGEDAASLESLIRDIVDNKVKHSKGKIELPAADITNVAAYWGNASKGKKAK